MTQITREVAWLAFGRAAVAVSPYISALSVQRPEQADALLSRLAREMAYLPNAVDGLLRRHLTSEEVEHDRIRRKS